MPDGERALIQAVAVLGDGVVLTDAAQLAELDVQTASVIADALAARGLLEPSLPLRFVHAGRTRGRRGIDPRGVPARLARAGGGDP